MEKTTNSHIKSIDSIKFLFSIIIVYFHLFHVQLRPYLSDSTLFQILTIRTFSAQLIVECFLITAGYFLFQTYLNTPKTSIANFFIKRFFRLWPVFFFYNIIIYFQTPTTLDELILNISFLHSTGISQNYYGAIWFISPFFWSGLLLFSILKSFERNKALIIISLITYFSYCINLNNLQGGVGRHVVYSFLSLAMLRTLGGLSLGILLGASQKYLISSKENTPKNKTLNFIIFSFIELILSSLLLYNFLIYTIFKNAFTTVVIFLALFYSLTTNSGIISQILNTQYLSNLGKYSYSIFVMQQVSFNILTKTLWQDKNFIYSHTILTIILSVIFAILIGIATYYLIERPFIKYYNKKSL